MGPLVWNIMQAGMGDRALPGLRLQMLLMSAEWVRWGDGAVEESWDVTAGTKVQVPRRPWIRGCPRPGPRRRGGGEGMMLGI